MIIMVELNVNVIWMVELEPFKTAHHFGQIHQSSPLQVLSSNWAVAHEYHLQDLHQGFNGSRQHLAHFLCVVLVRDSVATSAALFQIFLVDVGTSEVKNDSSAFEGKQLQLRPREAVEVLSDVGCRVRLSHPVVVGH
jgi:hypothetical protein